MKVKTLFMRPKKRDYFDLYSIVKSGMSLSEIYAESSTHFKGLTPKLFVTALTFIEDIEDENIDYLTSGEKSTLLEIQGFFKKELATFTLSLLNIYGKPQVLNWLFCSKQSPFCHEPISRRDLGSQPGGSIPEE